MLTHLTRISAAGVVAVALLTGCDAAGTDTTTSTVAREPSSTTAAATTTEVATTAIQALPLVEHVDQLYGLRTMVPAGWEQVEPGVWVSDPDSQDAEVLVVQFVPGPSIDEMLPLLAEELGAESTPTVIGTVGSGELEYQLYSFTANPPQIGQEVWMNMALASAQYGQYLVIAMSAEADAERARAQVLIPTLEALRPLESPPPVPSDAAYRDPALDVATRVDDLVSQMTLREKLGQMTLIEKNSVEPAAVALLALGGVLSGGGGSPADNSPQGWLDMVTGYQEAALSTRLAIPILYGVDAVHGHGNLEGATVFPHNIGLGATGDPDLVEAVARATAAETAATGIFWNYAPVLAVPQDVRWGRTYEGFGEDPDLVAELGAAYVAGLQGDDLTDPTTVLATPKHFVGDGGTVWGTSTTGDYMIDQGVMPADETALRETHLVPYVETQAAEPLSVMASFSSYGDEKVHAQRALLTDLLKEELGFEGFVVSDWGAIDQITEDYEAAVVTAINAGVDMNMVPYDAARFISVLGGAVESGAVPIERIDDAVRRILMAKMALGLFEQPLPGTDPSAVVGSAEHRDLARAAVSQSLVLLENDGQLPLDPGSGVIFVGGEAADDIGIQSGGWTIEWQGKQGPITEGTTILAGIEAAVDDGTVVYHHRLGLYDRAEADGLDPPGACVAVVGERPYAEGMGDNGGLLIQPGDLTTIDHMLEVCDELIVVLISGRPLIITDELDRWDAVVAAWLPGTEGAGVADGLFGATPFTGTLPYTWPAHVGQLPLGSTDEDPLYPLGFGLGT